MKKGPDMPGRGSHAQPAQADQCKWGPNGTTIAQDWQQRQIGKKSPGRHRSGRGEGCHSSHPSQGASKDRHLNSVRPVCGGSAKPRQKDGPERQSGARLAMMPIRREDTAKMGTRSLSPLRGRPLAKTRYFQGSRNRARKRTCHLRQTADSGPRPKRASYL
jgi:hypothetical protein